MFAHGTHFGWHLRPSTIAAALLGRPLAYLCWGVAYHRGIRRRLARMVLRAADVVFVNDARTADEVREVAGVEARRLPYLVDTDYFTPAAPTDREDFLFCPGANDRDGDVLLALARNGRRVIWLNNLPELAARYSGIDERLTIVSRPGFAELRDYYRRCAAVVQPLTRDIHAAGQTTTLEALACGAPVILGSGRTADLFAPDGLVEVVDGRDTATWSGTIERALSREGADSALAAARVARIVRDHAPEVVAARLVEALTQVRG
jgi:glycosyltransferase involved in cell wall biosynthesis